MKEAEVRKLRDVVYETTVTDAEWKICGPNWMRSDSIEWLKKKAKRPLTK